MNNMSRLITFLIFILVATMSSSQIEFDKSKFDFGELESYSARYVDIKLTNIGTKQEWILSVKKPYEVVYINSKQIIEKDSSVIIRLQVNPKLKGKFNYEVAIFTSDRSEAFKVKLTGSLRELDQNSGNGLTACPSFEERPGGKNPNSFDLTVVTIDKETREELQKSSVTLIQNGMNVWTKSTDKKGQIKEDATLGLSYFYARHTGYFDEELGAYINFQRNRVVIELKKDPLYEVPKIDTTTTIEIVAEVVEIEEHLSTPDLTAIVDDLPPAFADLSSENFDEQYFKPINVVFVLDVSSSMKQADKIELMKYSMNQLVDMIRPQDKMGIVTYASDARVLLKPTSGANKEEIHKEVEALKAFGYTSGGSGIKLGFKQAKKSMISDGTNQIIVVTDGAFNRNSDDYKRHVKKYAKKGIRMSVVGIKNKEVDKEEMLEAARLGSGHYIPVFNLSDARHNLKQEIRLQTYKF
mgnify:FL=1